MTTLVTGGSGFIGTEVVRTLVARGHRVVNYDLRAPRDPSHAAFHEQGDIVDLHRLEAVLAEHRPRSVIHLAAHAEITSTAWADFASIHEGTRVLMQAMAGCPSVERFLNVSTQLVIGASHVPRSLLDYRPYTTYGEAKAYAEALLLQWSAAIPWLIVRPANIWGPGHPTFAEAIWKALGNRTYLHPRGAPVIRSYGYVTNTAEQIVTLAEADPALTNRQIYYAADASIDSATWTDAFARAFTGRPARRAPVTVLRGMGMIGDATARLGVRIPIDSGRVHRITSSYPVPLDATLALTGPPRISLEEGIKTTLDWLAQRPGQSPRP